MKIHLPFVGDRKASEGVSKPDITVVVATPEGMKQANDIGKRDPRSQVLMFISDREGVSVSVVASKFGLTIDHAREVINDLIRSGMVRKVGPS